MLLNELCYLSRGGLPCKQMLRFLLNDPLSDLLALCFSLLSQSVINAVCSRMHGFLLDTVPSRDLDNLNTSIRDASSRVERAAFSRRLSTDPTMSIEELDIDSTKDIQLLKGVESDD